MDEENYLLSGTCTKEDIAIRGVWCNDGGDACDVTCTNHEGYGLELLTVGNSCFTFAEIEKAVMDHINGIDWRTEGDT